MKASGNGQEENQSGSDEEEEKNGIKMQEEDENHDEGKMYCLFAP